MTRTQIDVALKEFFSDAKKSLPSLEIGDRVSLLKSCFPDLDTTLSEELISLSPISTFEILMSVTDFLQKNSKMRFEVTTQRIFEKKWQLIYNEVSNSVTPILIKGESNTTVRRVAGKYLFFILNDSF